MRIAVLLIAAIAAIGIFAELSFRNSGPSDAAQSRLMAIVIASQCPSLPEAREVAVAAAYKYSVVRPVSLPPWWVFIANRDAKMTQTQENPVARGVCTMMIDKANGGGA